MSGFEYNGQSTATIIDTPLILVSTESPGNIVGSNRSKIEGNITISRPITNEYGTTHDPLSFTYSLMKSDLEPFSTEEQIAVERWLTSPKLSSELRITDCNNETYSYFGLFLSTEWALGSGGFVICTFTFQVNGRHAYKYYEYTGTSNLYEDPNDPTQVTSVADSFYMHIDCESDELEEYIYPKIEYTPVNSSYDSSILINNITDTEYQQMEITTNRSTTVVIDSRYCRLAEYIQNAHSITKLNYLTFKDLGLQDVGNIYWPRLFPRNHNILFIRGHVNIKVSFYVPIKKVGGWLI